MSFNASFCYTDDENNASVYHTTIFKHVSAIKTYSIFPEVNINECGSPCPSGNESKLDETSCLGLFIDALLLFLHQPNLSAVLTSDRINQPVYATPTMIPSVLKIPVKPSNYQYCALKGQCMSALTFPSTFVDFFYEALLPWYYTGLKIIDDHSFLPVVNGKRSTLRHWGVKIIHTP